MYLNLHARYGIILFGVLQVNTYGSLAGYTVGFTLRLMSGEQILGLPPLIKYPMFDPATDTQNFPFKTMIMILVLLVEISVSGNANLH